MTTDRGPAAAAPAPAAAPPVSVPADRDVARRVGATVSVVVGVVLLATGVVSAVAGTLPDTGTVWFVAAICLAFVAMAALDVSRPAPDRLSRAVHRCATITVPLTLLGAGLVQLLR